MHIDLNGRVAIITGSGQGIGEGLARVFSQAGAKIVVATRSRDNGQQTVDQIIEQGGDALLVQCDLGDRQQVRGLIEQTIAHYQRLDIIVHNAAVYPMQSIETLSDEQLEITLAVNLKAAFWLTQDALPYLRQQPHSRILFTSSVTGPRVVMPETAHYAASKNGLNGYIRTAALELARENITVNGVEPGYILTPAMDALVDAEGIQEMASQIPVGHLGVPEDIANAMLFLASEQAAYITGQTIVVDGGSTLPESPLLMNRYYADKASKVKA